MESYKFEKKKKHDNVYAYDISFASQCKKGLKAHLGIQNFKLKLRCYNCFAVTQPKLKEKRTVLKHCSNNGMK